MIRIILVSLLALISILPYSVCAAEEPKTVQVELVLFHNRDATTHLSEWHAPNVINTANAIELMVPEFSLSDGEPQPTPNFCLMPQDKLQLNPEEQKLAQSEQYQVMLHIAWTQSLDDAWHSKPVHVTGGIHYNIDGELANEIDGTVTVSQGKFINFKAQININEPSEKMHFADTSRFSPFSRLPEVLSYHLAQSRRMKLDELHYLDNPYFGMLVRITPVKVVALPTADSEDAMGSAPVAEKETV